MRHSLLIGVLILLAVIATTASAQTGGGYDLTWSTVDGGGGQSSNGAYTLAGTAGQLDAGVTLAGGGFTLNGGFWGGSTHYRAYLPLVLKSLHL